MKQQTTSVIPLADALGNIRAQIAELKKTEAALVAQVKDADTDVIEGDLFDAVRIVQYRTSINWKAIAAKLDPSRQLVTAHTSVKEVISVKTHSRVVRNQAA